MATHHYSEHRPSGPRPGMTCADCSSTAPRRAPGEFEYQRVIARDGTPGTPTGSVHRCSMAGCNGLRIAVRWPDGRCTFPCTRGLLPLGAGVWRIG